VDQESQKTLQTRFLDKKVTTIPFTLTDYETGQPLINPATGQPKQSTSVASYLSAFGFDTKNMDLQKAIQWVQESLSTPVVVVINWNDKSRKDASTGKWANGGLKKADFQVGTAEDGTPLYSETVEKNGVLYEAKAVVSYFKKSA
jgi:hypothetical protein